MRKTIHSVSGLSLLALFVFLPLLAKANPSQAVIWGKQMLAEKKYDDAIKYFSAAIKAEPKNADGYKGVGYAYIHKLDKDRGISYLRYALSLNTADTVLKNYLASLENTPKPAAQVIPEKAPEIARPSELKEGINPWIMGGTVAVLGVVMLFLF